MIDRIQLETWAKAIDDAGCWILFFGQLLGIEAALLLSLLFGGLGARILWRFLVVKNVNRLVVFVERKALRQ